MSIKIVRRIVIIISSDYIVCFVKYYISIFCVYMRIDPKQRAPLLALLILYLSQGDPLLNMDQQPYAHP